MANADGPWVRFYASDWLAGTRGMTAAETGVYITLIATMYERAEPLLRDDSRLARVCGLPTRNFALILDRLIDTDKITVDDSQKLWGRKVDMEVKNRKARAEKAADAARAKHEQNQRTDPANAPAKQAPSSARRVLRARVSEPEPDSKDIESLEAPQTRKRAVRLPADWVPSDADKDWLREKWPGVTSGIYTTQLERFRNYWEAKGGKDATKLDWSKTWRNWMLQERDRTGTAIRTSSREPTAAELVSQLAKDMENAERYQDSPDDQPPTQQHALPKPR